MDLQGEIAIGELSFQEIADKFNVPYSWVVEAADQLEEMGSEFEAEADPGDMDGDAASAFASIGWGVDEDYVIDNDYFD